MLRKKINVVLFSDLDGTFLDHRSYSCEVSLPVLLEALARGVTTVFCSSKTGEEIHRLQAELGLRLPFIAENGGGIYIPKGFFRSALEHFRNWKFYHVLDLGARHPTLLQAFHSVRSELGVSMRGFTDMSVEEVGQLCGFGPEHSALARKREYDEPFVFENETPEAITMVKAAFEGLGLQVTRGGRFFHLMGNCDKGKAVLRFTELFRKEGNGVRTAAIGDSQNDIPMLQQVDLPILVMKPDGSYESEVLKELPGVERAGGIGPAGWAKAIRRLCDEISDFTSSEGKQKT